MNSRGIPEDQSEALALLLGHWRLLVASALFQVVSGVVSMLAIQPGGDAFLDVWIGGAVAGPVGLAAGLLWHVADESRRRSTHWLLVGFLFFCEVMVAGLGVPAARLIR